jgi:hypothetical protein
MSDEIVEITVKCAETSVDISGRIITKNETKQYENETAEDAKQ